MYITIDDLINRFGHEEILQLSDPDNAGEIGEGAVNTAIADAQASIDSYLVRVVELPLSEVPANIKRICADLARRLLYTMEAPDHVKDAADKAHAWLRDVARGVAEVGVNTAGDRVVEGQGVAAVTSVRVADRAIDDDAMSGFLLP